jgi:glycosyltransferase involved in cell wall biosynthesis
MLKSKILLIDYIGQSNDRGQPVGHSVKTLKETQELLDGIIKAELIIPLSYEREFSIGKKEIAHFLKYHSFINANGIYDRVSGLWRKLNNLIRVFKSVNKDEILWFVHPDFFLFAFLFFYPFKIKNITLITMYMEGFNPGNTVRERIKNYFFKHTIQKVDLVVKNSAKIRVSKKEIFCPDYLYKEDRYKPYAREKEEYILCTGVMNRAKDLVNVIKAWRHYNGTLKLKIDGFFPDKKMLSEIETYAGDKIEITDRYLTLNEYYNNIAGAKFTLLSYKKSKYAKRTSGILLESIFLDTPVIAPGFLLDYTELPGIAYEKLADIVSILNEFDEQKSKELKKKMHNIRKEYSFETMKKRIAAALKKVTAT